MRIFPYFAAILSVVGGSADAACRIDESASQHYAVCEFNPAADDIRLFLNDESGEPFGDFGALKSAFEAKGETLVFAMNGGMYRRDRSPVGLFVENGEEMKRLSTKDGPGNFHMKPNGVFWIGDDGAAHVTETAAFAALFAATQGDEQKAPKYATQSGPMLIIDGVVHPRFLVDSASRKRRNGVGVREDGTVVFAISDDAVTFRDFAIFFRDGLQCPNALFLDGSISRIYAPEIGRAEPGVRMGPIVGVVRPKE